MKKLTMSALICLIEHGEQPDELVVLDNGRFWKRIHWSVDDNGYIDERGKHFFEDYFANNYDTCIDTTTFTGDFLTEEEREYFRVALKPWRNEVIGIEKNRSEFGHEEYEVVIIHTRGDVCISPYFEKDKWLKGMALDCRYTPEDLGIWE